MALTYNLPNSGAPVTLLGAWRTGQDGLVARYRLGNDPLVKEVRGWFSATTNYYPPASYDGNGNLIGGAVPRAMTNAEKLAYVQSLVNAAEDTPAAGAQVV